MKSSVAVSVIVAMAFIGCRSGQTLDENPSKFGTGKQLAVAPRSSKLLKSGFVDTKRSGQFGTSGSVWRMQIVSQNGASTRLHWLALYPDGRCLISLRYEDWSQTETDPRCEHAVAAIRLRENIAQSGEANQLRTAIATLEAQSCDYCHMPMLGRYSIHNDRMEINAYELPPFSQGPSMFGSSFDSTGVSKFIFNHSGDIWLLNQKESSSIYWSQDMGANRVFSVDHPALRSVRNCRVILTKIVGVIPPELPASWDW